MAKAAKREYVWLQCKECADLNYRTSVNVMGGTPKLQLKKLKMKMLKNLKMKQLMQLKKKLKK